MCVCVFETLQGNNFWMFKNDTFQEMLYAFDDFCTTHHSRKGLKNNEKQYDQFFSHLSDPALRVRVRWCVWV